jgi:glutaredoxin
VRFRLLLALLVALTLCGCQPNPPSPPQPPQPPKPPIPQPASGFTIAVIVDAGAESPAHAAVYDDVILREAVKQAGCTLVVADELVTNEANLAPENLKPYLEAANGKPLPWVVVGQKGVVLDSFPLPATSSQLWERVKSRAISLNTGDVVNGQMWDGKHWRKLGGCMAPRPGAANRWRVYGSQADEPIIPRDQWREVDGDWLVKAILDQNGYSSCCPCAATGAFRSALANAGLPDVHASVVDLYSRINGGSDSGAMLEDALTELCSNGVCTTDYAGMWGVTNRDAARKDGYQSSRAKNRILLAEWCPSVDAVASAIQRGRPVVFGTLVNSSFKPDAAGNIGPRRGGGGGGHAMYLVGLKRIGNEWYFRVVNSWGDDWGQGGKAWLHGSWLMTDYFQAWAISSVVFPSDTPLKDKRVGYGVPLILVSSKHKTNKGGEIPYKQACEAANRGERLTVLVSAQWCAPCKVTHQSLVEAGVPFATVDAEAEPEVTASLTLGCQAVPQLVAYRKDKAGVWWRQAIAFLATAP